MRRWRAPLAVLAVAAAALVAATALGGRGHAPAPRAAAELPRASLNGARTTLAGLRGRPALVVFWASWCAPCRREAPAVARVAATPPGRGQVVAVAWNDAGWSARAFVRQARWRFPVLEDARGAVGDRYRIRGLPTTYVLDARGRIVDTLEGPQTAASLRRALAEARA